jgi:DNA modification methylase
MDGAVADMIFTDPPYGVGYVGKTKRRMTIANDNLGDAGTRGLVARAMRAAPLRTGGVFYVCSAAGDKETAFRLALVDADLPIRQALVWVKSQFVLGHSDYHYKHETILYGWKGKARHHFVSDRTQHTVWEFRKPLASRLHPTQKPVPLVARALYNSSKPGDIVYDGFGGSGTTLMACEQTGRHCRMMEIDTAFCGTIIDRWEAQTGRQAELITTPARSAHTGEQRPSS